MTGRISGNLPVALTSFVGRRQEIADVRARLATARLLTLTGAGGVGKTRLALEVAAEARKAFADGVWLVDLAPVGEPALVPRAVVTALGIPDQSSKPAEEQLTEYLSERQALILIDNCEHLVGACALLMNRLLRGGARLRVLATSRRTLGVYGEHIYIVPPLSTPEPDQTSPLKELEGYESVRLFAERAITIQPGFEISERNRHTVTKLCARLEGIPLAIELAAARLRVLSLDELVERLEDRFTVLGGGSRTVEPRQRTLRALISWSYDLCSPIERLLWARLSVFAGGFSLDAVEGVCTDEHVPQEAVLDLLGQLITQSVVLLVDSDGQVRYRMLETIRQYGRERLVEAGELERLRSRHRDFYLDLAEGIAARWNGGGQAAGLARLRADKDNLRAALEYCVSDPDRTPSALALVSALRFHWCADGFLSEGRRWLDRVLARPGGDCPARATALWVAAWATLLQGDYQTAAERLDECEELGDASARSQVMSLRGTLANFQGRLAEAIDRFEQAIGELTAVNDGRGVLMTLFQLAIAQACAGDARAADTAKRAIMLSEECGELWCRSYALWSLGFDAWVRGELDSAAELTRAGLAIQSGFNDHVGTALMIELLAWVAASKGESRHAARLLGSLRAIWQRIGTTIAAFGPHLADHHDRCERDVAHALKASAFATAIAQGGRLDLGQAITCALDEAAATTTEPPVGKPALTRREHEVAQLVARGLSNRMIADSLVISPRTVDGHLEHILAKLGFTSRSQVAAWVTEHAHR
ncbi:putative ATPase/DNA-binding CsgD family transcriptional regulator [Kibdelosporangium banguiense]|uniref:ATPase/DNA-binding CsgD family transcriptional regulator n=1 Tax=Kibdelosporangium banguiense TaxID=1365924 RepID=A0ABS4TQ87_9PSEU|nr:LuxR C-terminal-related transcriptional regulator [Kibdelosporangium banguiense]MBP2326577.1 putative ATPase/DNA-binding CsgD family transcriptional regulator [Kibdelosporangium banguiense]